MMVIFLFRFINFNSMTVLINNSFSTKKKEKKEIGLLDFCSVVNSCTQIKKIGWDTWH